MVGFLKDVFICSLGAYGGPEAHISVFSHQLVNKKKHIKEEELIELLALCSVLPGPTSTQTIVSVGYKVGGAKLAVLTMIVWAMPIILVMTALSFLYQFLAARDLSYDLLRYISPMAVGFIIIAAFRIGRKVTTDALTASLLIFGAVVTYFIRTPWIFPAVLITGGLMSIVASKEKQLWNRVKLNPPWIFLLVFAGVALGSIVLATIFDNRLILLFERFYRYGYLVFGGGQVVVPVMHSELVYVNQLMTNQEFLTGYGLVQGMPGPMFSFSAYAGGMAARDGSALLQIVGALSGGIAIFLPGLLLIFFVLPVWENLKKINGIRVSIRGINAVAGGLIVAAAIILLRNNGLALDHAVVTTVTVLLLMTRKIPPPLIVVAVIMAGYFLI